MRECIETTIRTTKFPRHSVIYTLRPVLSTPLHSTSCCLSRMLRSRHSIRGHRCCRTTWLRSVMGYMWHLRDIRISVNQCTFELGGIEMSQNHVWLKSSFQSFERVHMSVRRFKPVVLDRAFSLGRILLSWFSTTVERTAWVRGRAIVEWPLMD